MVRFMPITGVDKVTKNKVAKPKFIIKFVRTAIGSSNSKTSCADTLCRLK